MRRQFLQMPPATRALALVLALLLVGFQALESGHVHQTAELTSDCTLCHGHAPAAVASGELSLPAVWLASRAPTTFVPARVRLERAPQQARAPPLFS